MEKCPFTNFFDVYGNGQTDFSEELLAMKVLEDALPAEESVSCDPVADDSLDIPEGTQKSLRHTWPFLWKAGRSGWAFVGRTIPPNGLTMPPATW